MNKTLIHLLASRFVKKQNDQKQLFCSLSPIALLSSVGIALGLSLILLTGFVISGFKSEIKSKLLGLTGAAQIVSCNNAYGQTSDPIVMDSLTISQIQKAFNKYDGAYVSGSANVMGIVKTDDSFSGIIFQGVDSSFRAESFFQFYSPKDLQDSLTKSKVPYLVLSDKNLKKLKVKPNDRLEAFFYTPLGFKVRKFVILQSFNTGMPKIDDNVAFTQISTVRSILAWDDDHYGNIKILMHPDLLSEERLISTTQDLLLQTQAGNSSDQALCLMTARQMNPMMFGWMSLLDMNTFIIYALLIFVAAMTMISGIIVLILDKVQHISLLKALGMTNLSVRKVFNQIGLNIILLGIMVSNIIAISIALIQKSFHVIKLDPTQYYMNYVPIRITFANVIVPNLLSFVVLGIMIYIPTIISTRIAPAKGLRFE